ncbi:MAG: hypothetical protein FJX20_00250 [Alphaproteobacteria bacterium]|nr:hypothetical protein [Alphaproteobacteria bacterium]
MTALVAVSVAGGASAQRGADRSSELLDALARRLKICSEMTDNGQRLACYDRIETDATSGAAAAPPPIAAPRPVGPPPGAGPVTAQPLPPPPGTPQPQPGDARPLTPPPAAQPQVFRDPVTGRVYDPGKVGQPDDKPVPPEDRAFDPRAQGRGAPPSGASAAPRAIEARTRVIGTVPKVSGPGSSVPLVGLEIPSLHIGPQGRWVLQINLANNSGQPFDASLACSFRNGDRSVDDVLIAIRGVRGGDKVTTEVTGPAAQVYVDNAPCTVRSPR